MIASDDEWVDETEWDNMFMKMKKEREKDLSLIHISEPTRH